jgi:hypothetical protein
MSSAYTQVSDQLKAIIDDEFAPEGLVAIKDDLHESLGRKAAAIGIAPLDDVLQPGNDLVQETNVEVKFYDLWQQEINPNTVVDPTRITDFAERFRAAVGRGAAAYSGTPELWYFDIRRITYPRDPTGNKTRFVATIRCKGNNVLLTETV